MDKQPHHIKWEYFTNCRSGVQVMSSQTVEGLTNDSSDRIQTVKDRLGFNAVYHNKPYSLEHIKMLILIGDYDELHSM